MARTCRRSAQRKLERVFSRQEYRRAFPGEIAGLTYPPRVIESYVDELLRRIDMTGVREAGSRWSPTARAARPRCCCPACSAGSGVDVLTVNNRLDESSPTQSLAQTRAGLQRLSELVSSSRADFGVRFDPMGERLTLVDDKGALVSDDRALLVVLDLICAERRAGRAAAAGHLDPGGRAGEPVPRGADRVGADLACTGCMRPRPAMT